MKIEDFNTNYQIIDYSLTRGSGSSRITLKWNYAKGTHFLIFLYDCRKTLNLEEMLQELEENGLDDKTLVQKNGNPVYVSKSGTEKLFLCREKEFIQSNRSYSISNNVIQRGIPYGISVFIGRYDKNESIMHLYSVKNLENNTRFLPVKIESTISYRSRFFSEEKICSLLISQLQDYEDGALEYYIDGVKTAYPIPASCLGKNMLIWIPKNSELSIRVVDKYKKYYRL